MQFCAPIVHVLLFKMKKAHRFGRVSCPQLLQLLGAIQTLTSEELTAMLKKVSTLAQLHDTLISKKRARTEKDVDKEELREKVLHELSKNQALKTMYKKIEPVFKAMCKQPKATYIFDEY